jgi:predicted XRE-type DNA-binding protein
MSDEIIVEDSCGNIFEDLGLSNPEERLAKADVALVICDVIRERGLTQTQAAEILGVRQPDVSDLMRGRLSRFSMERLERFLTAFDLDVRIQIGPRPSGKVRADVTVERVPSF